MFVRKIFTLLLLVLSLHLHGQFVTNGSMEGPTGVRTPVGWSSCLSTSTVDTQPGLWSVTRPAYDGNTFIDMVCRGSYNSNARTCEELAQTLNNTMEAGKCYRMELYMAFAPDFGVSEFRNPIDVRVSLGRSICNRDQEVVTFSSISHEEWQRYVVYYTPNEDMNAIWLEGAYSSMPEYFGHVFIDALSVEEVAAPPTTNIVLCPGESQTLNAFLAADASEILWNTNETSDRIEATNPGTYSARITLGDCVIEQQFEVSMAPTISPEFTSLTEICPGEEVLLDVAFPNSRYLWDDGSTQSTRTINSPGTYSVQIENSGCTESYSFTLPLGSCEALLNMPNAFSPNQDGKNDLFTPIDMEYVASMQTVIYSRWGKVIFSSNKLTIEWDGLLPNGEPAPTATYFWHVTYLDLQGQKGSQKGNVTILK